jgi:hypothetical protein
LGTTHTSQKPKSGKITKDPRLIWRTGGSADEAPNAVDTANTANAADAADPVALTGAPVLRHRRDGILPAVAAALSVRGETLTCTGSKADTPPQLHPLVADFIDSLPVEQRERTADRCPEPILLSRFLTAADAARKGRAARKPYSHSEAKQSLKDAKLTARRIREDGDPEHGAYAPPCRACTPLLAHFGVRAVGPSAEGE